MTGMEPSGNNSHPTCRQRSVDIASDVRRPGRIDVENKGLKIIEAGLSCSIGAHTAAGSEAHLDEAFFLGLASLLAAMALARSLIATARSSSVNSLSPGTRNQPLMQLRSLTAI